MEISGRENVKKQQLKAFMESTEMAKSGMFSERKIPIMECLKRNSFNMNPEFFRADAR